MEGLCASRNYHGHAFNSWAAVTLNTSGLMDSSNCTALTSDLTNLRVPEW